MSRERVLSLLLTLNWLCLSQVRGYYSLEVGDPCPTPEYRSSCQPSQDCKTVRDFIESRRLTTDSVVNCGYTTTDEKICCPLETDDFKLRTTFDKTTTTTTSTTSPTTTASPPWLSIFNTTREYLVRSVATVESVTEDIVFPGRSARNDAACQAPLYEGDCLPISKCGNIEILLQQQRLRDEDVYTCRAGTTEEIICCPITLPLQPRAQIDTDTRVGVPEKSVEMPRQSNGLIPDIEETAAANAIELLTHYKYLAALAYPNARFDGHVHRCTAIMLSPQLLLTSAGCGRPSHAVFGVADMRDVDEEEDDLADITKISVYRQDLAFLSLPQPHQGEKASVCSYYEQTRWQISGNIVATAWAKGNDSDCPLYELPMRMLPSTACKDIPNSGGIQDLPSRHMCVEPRNPESLRATNSSSCVPCPSAVGSILHLQRSNGRRCVLGVATPTGDNCQAEVMYYTSLVDRQLFKFVEDLRLNL